MENESGMSVKGFILRVILVVLFVFLLMWLFPMPNLEPVYDSIFAQNIETMKGAAKDYYTVERLPKEVGQSVRMTLDEMLSMKLLLPLKDSDGDTCSGSSSYVEVSKTDTEYLIKTQLTCPNKADYIITHFGCYDICSDKCKVAEQTSTDNTKTVIKKTDYKPTPTPSKYLYTYRKDWSETTYGPWTDWSSEAKYADNDNISFGCTDTKCTEEAPDSPRNEVTGTKVVYDYDKPIYREALAGVLGTYTITACTGYDYTIYQNYGTYSYTTGTDWQYQGIETYSYYPDDTPTTHYEYAGLIFDKSCVNPACTSTLIQVKKYTLNAKLVTTSTSSSSISITCSSYSTKTIPVYGKVRQLVTYQQERVAVYGSVKYYRYKTRPKNIAAAYDIKTRTYKDQTLINNGYRLISTTVVK